MEILKARELGFCFGVKRAVDLVERHTTGEDQVDSLGSIVHNRQVLNRLNTNIISNIEGAKSQTVAITAHGVGPQVLEDIKSLGLGLLDTTCPIVRDSQIAAKRLVEAGFFVIIYGDDTHPEIKGVLGWAKGNGLATKNPQDLSNMARLPRRIGVLSQTTQPPAHFAAFARAVLDISIERALEVRVINTTCDATTRQQQAAKELARSVDLVIVVGGKNSANTRHLAELCEEEGVSTRHVESPDEINRIWFNGKERVGVTGGASTPDASIGAVVTAIKEFDSPHPEPEQQRI